MESSVSQKQLEANRRNSKLSTGPKTADGKAKVRWNALKHGLLASSVVLKMENFEEQQEDFDFLLRELVVEHAPKSILEGICVEKIAITYWRLRRVMRAENGEIGKGWFNAYNREAEKMEMLENMAKVSPTSFPLEKTYSKSAAGIDAILKLLSRVKIEISEKGYVNKNTQELLYRVFGKDHKSVSGVISAGCKITKQREQLIKKDAKKYEKLPSEEVCKKEMLEVIEDKCGYYKSIICDVEELEFQQSMIDQQSLSLPSEKVSQKTLRYEAALERQLYRAIDQLERLQRRRLGDIVPPPINVNVKTDS